MLLSLHVKDFAIIDDIHIDFNAGMTVLTGETGAGKTLIIDAIGLLFGNRASTTFIRHGADSCVIEGVFTDINNNIATVLKSLDLEIAAEDYLIIKREIFSTGKSVCRVNNNIITLGQLNEITQYLGDIHSQFDTQGLVNPKNYLQFLATAEIDELLSAYQQKLQVYTKNLSNYKQLVNRQDEGLQRLDFLKYQVEELKVANLSVEEEDELLEKFKILNNLENILQNKSDFINTYEEKDILPEIYNSINNLNKLSEYDKQYQELAKIITDAYYMIKDVYEEIAHEDYSSLDISELELINERLGLYASLRRKYKLNTHELIDYYQKITHEINQIENYDEHLKIAQEKVVLSFNETLVIAREISELRRKRALEIETKMLDHLQDLQLKNVDFKIEFLHVNDESPYDSSIFQNDGIDLLDFKVSFNIGEPLNSLSKVASGGELSRFMLSLKTVTRANSGLQLMIFDEIDSGVSGLVAYSIAEKIKEISKNSQVLCVTHLPQVAAIGDFHINIVKETVKKRTISVAHTLSIDERISEIAKMISHGEVTDNSKKMAQELIYKFAN